MTDCERCCKLGRDDEVCSPTKVMQVKMTGGECPDLNLGAEFRLEFFKAHTDVSYHNLKKCWTEALHTRTPTVKDLVQAAENLLKQRHEK